MGDEHTSTEQPYPLGLADQLEIEWRNNSLNYDTALDAAIELRRLHHRVMELIAELEAAQAQRAPLSDSEIDDAWEGATGGHSFTDKTRRDFVRAIEKAHGITQEKQG